MKGVKTETKVGIFVVLGIIILAYMTIKIEKIEVGEKKGYQVYVDLDSAQGLVKNSIVRIAGVDVGRVEGISLKDGKARVRMNISKDVKLRKDSKVYIRTEGLLGEKYVEIAQGSPKESFVEPKGVIVQGAPPVDIDQLVSQLNSIAGDIKSVTEPLSKVLGGKEGEESVRNIVGNIKDVTGDLKNIIKNNEKKIDSLLTNLDNFSRDLPNISKDTRSMVASLDNVAKKIEKGEGTLGKLVNDKKLYDEAKETLENLNKVAKKIEKGEGTLGKLINDKELYDEAKKALRNVNKSAEGIQEQIPLTTLGIVVGTVVK